MFLDESSNGAVFTESTITNIYKTLNEANEEYARLAIKMCKYEHQAILTEDTALLEEAKESFGEKVKKVIQKIWRSIVDAIAKFKNWIRQIIINIGGKNAARSISDKLIEAVKKSGTVNVPGISKETFTKLYTSGMSGLDIFGLYNAGFDYENGKNVTALVPVDEDQDEKRSLPVTAKMLETLKNSLEKELPKAFEDIRKVENDARKKYSDSLKNEDKEEVSNAAKATALSFKVCRKTIKVALKIVSAVKKALRSGEKVSKNFDNLYKEFE